MAKTDAETGAGGGEKVEVRVEPATGVALEGGLRGWLVVVASFLCNGIIFGVINSVGVIYGKIQETLLEAGDEDASAKACKLENYYTYWGRESVCRYLPTYLL